MNTNRLYCFLSFILLSMSINSVKAMDANDVWKQLAICSAQFALASGGDSRSISDLQQINEADLRNVKKYKNDLVESYMADLPGGDSLEAHFYLNGSEKDQISCIRHVLGVMVPVGSHYFDTLKKMAEREEKTAKK